MLCPRCAMVVALHEGEPVVTPAGVALFHRSCPLVAAIEPIVVVPVIRARSPWPIRVGASVLALGLAFCAWPRSAHSTAASDNVVAVAAIESIAAASRHVARDDAPPAAMTPEQRYPIPTVNGQLLSETFPSLIDWIHPVADAT